MKRAYSSKNRKTQALQTRQDIINTAKNLFEELGFDKVTVNMIAEKAQVSAPTIFALFKSKVGILKSILDSAFDRHEFEELVKKTKAAKNAMDRIRIAANMTAQIYMAENKVSFSLQNLLGTDLELKSIERELEERRYERQKETIEIMLKNGELNDKLDLKNARDIFWVFTGRDLFRLFVIEKKWSVKQYENMLVRLLYSQLCESEN